MVRTVKATVTVWPRWPGDEFRSEALAEAHTELLPNILAELEDLPVPVPAIEGGRGLVERPRFPHDLTGLLGGGIRIDPSEQQAGDGAPARIRMHIHALLASVEGNAFLKAAAGNAAAGNAVCVGAAADAGTRASQ